MSCNVCDGTPGRYPIFGNRGRQLYEITCPECGGSGLDEEEADFAMRERRDRARYDAAMDNMRRERGLKL